MLILKNQSSPDKNGYQAQVAGSDKHKYGYELKENKQFHHTTTEKVSCWFIIKIGYSICVRASSQMFSVGRCQSWPEFFFWDHLGWVVSAMRHKSAGIYVESRQITNVVCLDWISCEFLGTRSMEFRRRQTCVDLKNEFWKHFHKSCNFASPPASIQ